MRIVITEQSYKYKYPLWIDIQTTSDNYSDNLQDYI